MSYIVLNKNKIEERIKYFEDKHSKLTNENSVGHHFAITEALDSLKKLLKESIDATEFKKEALKLAIPEILEEVVNKAKIQKYYSHSGRQEDIDYYETDYCSLKVNKELITSLSESLIEKYTK